MDSYILMWTDGTAQFSCIPITLAALSLKSPRDSINSSYTRGCEVAKSKEKSSPNNTEYPPLGRKCRFNIFRGLSVWYASATGYLADRRLLSVQLLEFSGLAFSPR